MFGVVGSSFDQRQFNHEVLSLGKAPLSILERHINSWIASSAAAANFAASLTSCHVLTPVFFLVVFICVHVNAL